ncbi:uncharacterized protein PV09_02391 [Verruconis gallopava]|uniref:C2H2-type domain-containing protein n=1 Tax=Verruconis gallopava TaxID=253628 RepID=A0A0D1XV64_9PEZI|nr:uncharacterized protein PV09_02391 [Verruconis gallopava]KIW06686.1 hypothetical protein PV09_02391 [Verruconis gallopava]
MESPGSPLSEHSEDEFQYNDDTYHTRFGGSPSPSTEMGSSARPSKRQKTGPNTHRETSGIPSSSHHLAPSSGAFDVLPTAAAVPDEDEDISSDTDGSVPGSPHLASAAALPGDDDDGGFGHKGEQISFCRWEGCEAGEMGNMDLLVQHLHDEHIHARQKKYSCEWADCSRKGIPHASGYALRAHMRSHTREKPFYCTLPECDRSFTRSDALAKHMRTVHETEALRPSDPVPKHHSSNPQNKNQKLRLTFKAIGSNGVSGAGGPGSDAGSKSAVGSVPASPMAAPSNSATVDEEYEHNNVIFTPATGSAAGKGAVERQFPAAIDFTEEELALPPGELYKVLMAQIKWASEEGEKLRREVGELDQRRKREWNAKELALENVMEAEAADMERRLGRKGREVVPDEAALMKIVGADVTRLDIPPRDGKTLWWREERKETAEAMEGIEEAKV